MFRRFSLFYLPALLIVWSLMSPCVLADEVLDEIIVSADFRGRTASEVSPSISVLDQATIERSAIQHFEELVYAIPNLNFSGDGHRARYFQIRGIGELEQYEGAPNPSVGFLIDDIDFSGIATIATLFDIEQVEVLRGPQGTRYGANSLAGLVYVRSVAPTPEWTGRMQVGAGSDDALSGGLAVGGPLAASGAAFRVSAHHHESNGFRDNAFLDRERTNGRRETAMRASIAWDTAANWDFSLTALAVDIDDGYDAFAIDNSLTVLSDMPGQDAQQSVAGALRAVWTGSELFELTSITAYADSAIDFSFDADWGNAAAWDPYTYDFVSVSDRQRRTFSQELRLASSKAGRIFGGNADWLLGVYAMRLDEALRTVNRGIYEDPFAEFSLSVDDRLSSAFKADTIAVFGELGFDVGERASLTLGIRAERRDANYEDTTALRLDPVETMFGGEMRLRYMLLDNLTLFASIARGFKAGGFNLGAIPVDRREFEQETLWNAEAGMRSTWLEGNLVFNAAVFANLRQDQQARTSFQLVPNDPASFVFFTDNAARGEAQGLELDARYTVNESWTLHMSAGLLRAKFSDFRTPQVDLGGRDQAHAPRYTLNAGAEWRNPSGLFARLDVVARDDFYFDVSHDQKSRPYELVNARLGFDNEQWGLQLWGRNLLDERHAVRGFFFGNEPPDFPATLYVRRGDPRQIGVTLDVRF